MGRRAERLIVSPHLFALLVKRPANWADALVVFGHPNRDKIVEYVNDSPVFITDTGWAWRL
jgi:hypothetical protein